MFDFGVSGKLIMNALVMYDRQTDSLWSQFLGEAVHGAMAGTKLELVSSQLMSFGDWKEQFPDTLVLDTVGASFDPYGSYYRSNAAGILGEKNPDDRLFKKELVIGIVGEASQKAYSYRRLARFNVINDVVGGRPLVVTFNGDSNGVSAFNRKLDGRLLAFVEGDEPLYMMDTRTGSQWNKTSGISVSGEMEGKSLERVAFIGTFWFAWSDFYPETEVYEPVGEP